MSARRRVSDWLEGRRAERMAAEALAIVSEPGKPRAGELAGLQLVRQGILADVAAGARQPDGWPMEVA